MPLIPPRLDDRSYEDLVAELLARIPAHTPEWRYAPVGDPGRTLIELFAWLADTILYRANLVPERQRLVFLRLLGMRLRPAVPARGLVACSMENPDVLDPVTFRRGARLNGPPAFETQDELVVLPVQGRVFVKRALGEEQRALADELLALYRAERSPEAARAGRAIPYTSEALLTDGAPLRGGFDLIEQAVDRAVWIALLAPKAESVAGVRELLRQGEQGRELVISVGFVPVVSPPGGIDAPPAPREIAHVWEAFTSETLGGRPVYASLDRVSDTTRGLTRDGVVRLVLSGPSLDAPANDVRVQVDAGVGDLPPRVDDAALAARVVTWIRLRPKERLSRFGLSWIGVNCVEIEQTTTTRGVDVGTATGVGNWVLPLPATSVDPTSLVLEVEESDRGFQRWQEVDDLAACGRDERVFVLDAEAGSVTFGDDVRGKAPEPGARVRVAEMRSGGGARGNLPARTLTRLTGSDPSGDPVSVSIGVLQPFATRGGVDAETLARAEERIPALLRSQNRAVTSEDFRSLARSTPGLEVARVEVLPRFKPQQRQENVPGAVSVMVFEESRRAGFVAPAPRADRFFLESVHVWLDERRPAAVELYVIAPAYVPLGVSVGVEIRPGFGREETLADVRLALRAFLWPLAPGGALGAGWQLGMSVLAPEVAVAVARVPGVSSVRGVRLFERRDDDWSEVGLVESGLRGLRLRSWELPELLSVLVVAERDAPSDLRALPDPFADGEGSGAGGEGGGVGIPVPITPDVC